MIARQLRLASGTLGPRIGRVENENGANSSHILRWIGEVQNQQHGFNQGMAETGSRRSSCCAESDVNLARIQAGSGLNSRWTPMLSRTNKLACIH